MKSLLQQIEEAFEAVEKTNVIITDMTDDIDDEELDEISTSAGAGAYMTPNAFAAADDDTVESLGYTRVREISTSPIVHEILDSKYEQLIESYRSFKTASGDKKPSKTIKESITDIARRLKEIEESVKYASRFKNESGVTSAAYGPSTTKALTKISERLIKISERVRSLGE
jgi:hypothetical protein